MKHVLLLFVWLLVLAPGLRAADDDDPSAPDTTGTQSGFTPDHGDISAGTILTVSFPIPMVTPDKIDMGGQPWPIMATPKVDGTFLWKSQTEGQLTISSVVAGATHHFSLIPGLKDVAGHPWTGDAWNVNFTTPAFSLSTDAEFHKQLSAQPRIPLSSTYDVLLTDVARHAWIQDRDSRAHLPVEVIQTTNGAPEATEFQIAPRDPLPPNHTYDLVVEGLPDSKSRRPLPYPAVFPLGDTQDLKIEWLGGFNTALASPTIRIKFNDSISPDAIQPGMVQITPDVAHLDVVAEGDEIDLTGDFDLAQRYRVTVSNTLRGDRGYTLPADSRWYASFPPRQPCISFPGPRIYLRSSQQLHFTFLQSHTPAVTWRLASIPLEKLPAVTARLSEFDESALDPLTGLTIPDPRTGGDLQKQTELLVDAFNLPVQLTGSCPAADTASDVTRSITAPLPAGVSLQGPYLIEASSNLPDGRIAGGRALVFFSDYILTQKRSPTQVFIHIAGMKDALPAAGITVHAVRDDNIELGGAVTGSNGIAVFPRPTLFPENKPQTTLFIADTHGGASLGFADESTYGASGFEASAPDLNRSIIITDRNLYRPGEEVKMKGILRDVSAGGLAIPASHLIHWQILQGDGDKAVADGTTPLNTEGAFEASWSIPTSAALGPCTIKCSLGDKAYSGSSTIDIEEYRVPLFTVEVSGATETGTTAHAQVASAFFHGGANNGARVHWTAEWSSNAGRAGYNAYPTLGPAIDADNPPHQTLEGDTRLDNNGLATLACESPFEENAAVSSSHVTWTADVTSIDGQTLTGGTDVTFSSTPVILNVGATEQLTDPRGISVTLEADDPDGNPVPGHVKVTADLYHVTTKTVKEQVAPLVFRYRNTDEFAKVDSHDDVAPGSFLFSATNTGRYVVTLRSDAVRTPLVAAETTVTGDQPAEMPVQNDTGFNLVTRPEPWRPGDTAEFTVQAPFAGVAWVCVETDKMLDTMLVPLSGNAARIEVPVKKEYAPNATLSVYLTRPGGPSGLPVERFASTPFVVERPDRELELTPHFDHAEFRPGDTIHGEFRATSEGKPVAAADLAVFAVDDAVLQLGDWSIPQILSVFYPDNPYSFSNYQSLTDYIESGNIDGNFQKGFVIGDGGAETGGANALRKEFRTLAYWNASLHTDADGKVRFDFKAPDNLTSYRIVGIGQTSAGQFGGNAGQTVTITKPLLIDPALPRFVRDGDEVELRAVVRQSFADSAPVSARCITGSGCTLEAEPALSGTADRNAPWVLRFRAKIKDPDLAPIKVRFEATAQGDPTMADAVETTIPVNAPTIVRHESVSGGFTGPGFDAPSAMPKDWAHGRGQYSFTLSTSSWLPALAGIPTILDYPHGCFEQITSKLLCYGLLANLMDYLPDTEARLADYKPIFQKGVDQISSSLLADNRLPYWPGDTMGDDFVTCQACWALNEAANAGFDIPDGLEDKLSKAATAIASGPGDMDTRAFALFVLGSLKTGGTYAAIADDIYLHRQNMSMDGRAFLAMALHQLNIMPDEKLQLLREIDKTIVPTAFKPETFGSMNRTEGICAMAFETIAPPNFTATKKEEIRKRLLHILDTGSALSATPDEEQILLIHNAGGYVLTAVTFSTQENLWLILAFKSMLAGEKSPALAPAQPAPSMVSKNGLSAAWTSGTAGIPFGSPFALSGVNKSALTFLMHADFSLPQLDVPRVDRGFRTERVVRDLTAPARVGTAAAPYHIGDQLLVTYRIFSEKQQYFVALEDSFPAAFETVNPNLAQVARFFELPAVDPSDQLLDLSHSEMRDSSTLLYFNNVPPGPGVYSILVRVTAAGTFRWPQTQVNPMYDSRFAGLSASSVCVVSAQ